MYTFAYIQFLVISLIITVSCKAIPPERALTSRDFTKASFKRHPLTKREAGQDLWDRLQSKLSCDDGGAQETANDAIQRPKFQLYAPFRPPFKREDRKGLVGFDIRPLIRTLAGSGDADEEFTYRETTNARSPSGNSVCFQHNFLVSRGIIIAEINDRDDDEVPKAQQLTWSNLVFYTYEEMNNGDVSNLSYIFQHGITNDVTNAAVDRAYDILKLDRMTDQTWTYADTEKRAGFLAILETRNVQGVAYMLTDHTKAMGRKNVKKIVTLKHDASNLAVRPSLYVEIG